ncbi:fibroblast growth factor-binding protein 1 [Halichoeres trimaculatus]|uniref:fibroblast growth factor-binding protein 1 n=1 Tax=Halichoeres trimaculatus TaxID=147232 RepID=UPI003D9EF249
MALLTHVALLLVLACFSHQLMPSSCQRSHGRRGRGVDRGQSKDRTGLRVSRQPVKGKLLTKDRAECTWAATGEDVFILGVSCKKGGRSFSCEYVSRPTLCPQFVSNSKLYWKQVARSLRKQKTLCQDRSALVRAGMCRKADRAAHFRLRDPQTKTDPPPSTQPAPGAAKSCQSENMKLAEEVCHKSWSSFCTLFFTMINDSEC